WFEEMGVDEAIGEEAPDYFQHRMARSQPVPSAPSRVAPPIQAASVTVAVARSPLPSPEESIAATRHLAEEAQDLPGLCQAVEQFKGLAICKTATNTVFADGNPEAEIMLIGEAPGADEDARGIPFCGASGQL